MTSVISKQFWRNGMEVPGKLNWASYFVCPWVTSKFIINTVNILYIVNPSSENLEKSQPIGQQYDDTSILPIYIINYSSMPKL